MKIINYEDIPWNFNPRENVHIGWSEIFEYKGFDLAHAKIDPGKKLNMHFHERKDDGEEVFFFFKGGHIQVKTDKEEKEINSKKQFYISFRNKEPHEILNLNNEELEFMLIYSPPFDPNEVQSGMPISTDSQK
jgi:mannose-6-phosphate isomerase-like protein (cupin superfamily)